MNERAAQLRDAKRRQRRRDKIAGLGLVQLRLESGYCDRLKFGMRHPEFVARLQAFLDREVICVDEYPNLALLCWNRHLAYMTREDAFKLYESQWRNVDTGSMNEHELALIRELTTEFGNGLLNA